MTLPAHAAHERLGARFADRNGWTVPLDYGDPVAEHRTTRRAAGVVDWSDRGKLRVGGPDRVAFLHAIVSNDIRSLQVGAGVYALALNGKGQIQAEFPVYATADSFLLTTEPYERQFTVSLLRRYKLRSNVALGDETEQWAQFTLAGRAAPTIMHRLAGFPVNLAEFASATVTMAETTCFVAGSRTTGEVGYELFAPAPAAVAVWDCLVAAGAAPVGRTAYESLRIEAGTPRYGPELNEQTLPPELRLEDRAVHPAKGCYPGQEIMARIRNRGHVNRFLVGLVIDPGDPPTAGTIALSGDREVGKITSAAFSPSLERPVALALIRREHAEPGAQLVLADGRRATVTQLPITDVRA